MSITVGTAGVDSATVVGAGIIGPIGYLVAVAVAAEVAVADGDGVTGLCKVAVAVGDACATVAVADGDGVAIGGD